MSQTPPEVFTRAANIHRIQQARDGLTEATEDAITALIGIHHPPQIAKHAQLLSEDLRLSHNSSLQHFEALLDFQRYNHHCPQCDPHNTDDDDL